MQSSLKPNYLYYFCYGSNLLKKRMLINNKSAEKFSNGLLQGFRLKFSGYSKLWKGSCANIIPDPNSHVYGVIYTLSEEDLKNLDNQEIGYNAIQVPVQLLNESCDNNDQIESTNNSKIIECRTYVQKPEYSTITGQFKIKNLDPNYRNGLPSSLYKEIIIKGAEENFLPKDYIENILKKIEDNGVWENCGPNGFQI